MLNLNFSLYTGKTRLRNWWGQVKAHFTEVQNAHNALEQTVSENAAETEAKIRAEESERSYADAQLSARISAEISARENADGNLENSIRALDAVAHSHDNFEVLSGISEDDVVSWRDRVDYNEHNLIMLEYLSELCRGFSAEIRNLYGAAGYTVYDGGIDGETEDGPALDGGGFEDEITAFTDCGGFEDTLFTVSAVTDGGTY